MTHLARGGPDDLAEPLSGTVVELPLTVPLVAVQTLRPSAAKAIGPPSVEVGPLVVSMPGLILVGVDERRLATHSVPSASTRASGARPTGTVATTASVSGIDA